MAGMTGNTYPSFTSMVWLTVAIVAVTVVAAFICGWRDRG